MLVYLISSGIFFTILIILQYYFDKELPHLLTLTLGFIIGMITMIIIIN